MSRAGKYFDVGRFFALTVGVIDQSITQEI